MIKQQNRSVSKECSIILNVHEQNLHISKNTIFAQLSDQQFAVSMRSLDMLVDMITPTSVSARAPAIATSNRASEPVESDF